jgi:hypothetical protein
MHDNPSLRTVFDAPGQRKTPTYCVIQRAMTRLGRLDIWSIGKAGGGRIFGSGFNLLGAELEVGLVFFLLVNGVKDEYNHHLQVAI